MTGNGISSDDLMKALSDDAKVVLGCCFGPLSVPGRSTFGFGMKKSRPTARVQVAFDELVAAGAVKRTDDGEGGVDYVVQIACDDFARWAKRNQAKAKFPLTEPVETAVAVRATPLK
jgi:hypothetical protein